MVLPLRVTVRLPFAGSTAAMTDYVEQRRPKRVVLITECSMASNIKGDVPGVEFVGPCNLCPHMKRITLENIRDCLLHMQFEVTVPQEMLERGRLMADGPPAEVLTPALIARLYDYPAQVIHHPETGQPMVV